MIELKQVTKQYGQATVLKKITLSIDEPGIYCLLGRNGAGKTTLLKSIAGYQNITDGTIQVDGKVITTSTLDTGVSYIENFAKHFNLPVRKPLTLTAKNGDISGTVIGSYDDFAIQSEIKKGDSNLPDNKDSGDKTLKVSSNNGDVNIEFVAK